MAWNSSSQRRKRQRRRAGLFEALQIRLRFMMAGDRCFCKPMACPSQALPDALSIPVTEPEITLSASIARSCGAAIPAHCDRPIAADTLAVEIGKTKTTLRFVVSATGCLPKPVCGAPEIATNASPFTKVYTQVVLGHPVSVICRTGTPSRSGSIIARHATAPRVAPCQIVLRMMIAPSGDPHP